MNLKTVLKSLRNSYEVESFFNGGSYHIETNPLICSENQWTGFYIIGTSVMKELKDNTNQLVLVSSIFTEAALQRCSWENIF